MVGKQKRSGQNSIESSTVREAWRNSYIARVTWWLLFGVFTFLIAGYFFHSSPKPAFLGKYSMGYAVVLVGATALWALYLWNAWRLRKCPGTILKWIAFYMIMTTILVAVVIPYGAWKHYARGEQKRLKEPYHPFLQGDYHPINPSISKEKPPEVLRIVCLGGSTTAHNWKVDPPGWGYPWYLEQELEKTLGPDAFEIINFGTPMYSSEHSLIVWLTAAQEYHPDIVIVMHAINDLIRSFENSGMTLGPFRNDYGNYYGTAVNWAMPRDPYIKELTSNAFFNVWYSDFRETKGEVTEVPFENFRSIPVFKRNMRLLAKNIKLAGANPIFMTQPFLYHESMTPQELAALTFPKIFCVENNRQADIPSLLAGMKRFNEITRSLAREEEITCIDLETAISSNHEYFIDDVHYTKEAKKVIAQEIHKRLQELGLFGSK